MHLSIQARREIVDGLHQRSQIAIAEFYALSGRERSVSERRFRVRPIGRDFFHIVDSRTGKVKGFRLGHEAACNFAAELEQLH